MIKNFLSSIVVSLFLILLVILCSENDKEESRHEPQNTWFYMPTQKEVEYEGYFYPFDGPTSSNGLVSDENIASRVFDEPFDYL